MSPERMLLRDLLIAELRAVAKQLAELRIAIEQMAKSTVVSYHELDMIKLQIASLSEATQELESRVNALEAHNGMVRWIGRQVVTGLIVFGVAWLIGVLT